MNLTAKQQLRRNVDNGNYSNPTKSYQVPAVENPDGTINIPAQVVYPIDPNLEPIVMVMPTRLLSVDPVTGVIRQADVAPMTPNNPFNQGNFGTFTFAAQSVYENVAGNYQQVRTPVIFKTLGLTTAAGDTVLWDPAAGKKFRLMGVVVDIAAGTTAAAASLLQLRDQAVVISNHTICGGALAASAGRMLVNHVFPGNGYLSVAADNILHLNLSTVLAAGGVTAFCYGTEE